MDAGDCQIEHNPNRGIPAAQWPALSAVRHVGGPAIAGLAREPMPTGAAVVDWTKLGGVGHYDPDWQRKAIEQAKTIVAPACTCARRPVGGWSDCGPDNGEA